MTPASRRRINGLRGDILDRETAETIVRKHLAYAIGVLARPLGMRREELRAKIEDSKGKWVPIAKDLPEDVADNLREAVDQQLDPGFRVPELHQALVHRAESRHPPDRLHRRDRGNR